ncbi:MAG: response regulator [Oscillospiraceae bacterium]|nr:response regulator [Oscillospiraceae bacterium]
MKTIFLVDDSNISLAKGEEALEDHYRVMTLPSAAKMFGMLAKVRPDLILLDIEMPAMNGFEALKLLKADDAYAGIPVIFVTGRNDTDAETLGFELGAVDFVTKPFSPPVLLNRIKSHLGIDELVRERTAQLERLKNGIVSVLADMVESRDMVTGGHIERTTMYIKILMLEMLARGLHIDDMGDWDLDMVASSARLHDVGKISVSDVILNKPGKLTAEEFDAIKPHTVEGERIIGRIAAQAGDESFLRHAKLFAGYHHERWDGTGYPYGLKGADIPLHGRIMAIADVYDALVSERPYKKPFPGDEAARIIMAGSGSHFDPDIADVFYSVRVRFKAV